jgi:hypothetical protein
MYCILLTENYCCAILLQIFEEPLSTSREKGRGTEVNHRSMPAVPKKVLKCTRLACLALIHAPMCSKQGMLNKKGLEAPSAIFDVTFNTSFFAKASRGAFGQNLQMCRSIRNFYSLNFMHHH